MTREEVLAWLMARVEVEENGCLLWRLSVNGQGHPIASVDGKNSRAVRPWLFRQLKGEPKSKHVLVPRCDDLRCVEISHCLQLSPTQMNLRLVKQGRWNTAKRLASQMRNGLKCSPYTQEQVDRVRRLRAEGLTLEAISKETGVHHSSVSRMCLNNRRLGALPGSSVFALRAVPTPRKEKSDGNSKR